MATTTTIRSKLPPAIQTDTNPKRQRGSESAISLTLRLGVAPNRQQDNLWIAQRYRDILEDAGLAGFDEVMNTKAGRCLRVLPDRENWYLHCSRHTPCAVRPSAGSGGGVGRADGTGTVPATGADGTGTVPATMGMYLKKHRTRSWATRIAAALARYPTAWKTGCRVRSTGTVAQRWSAKTHQFSAFLWWVFAALDHTLQLFRELLGAASPPSPGRVEAENALALLSLGIDVMPLMAYGEKLHADGRLESFLLSEELEGYCELQDFIQRRFPSRQTRSPQPSPASTQFVVPERESALGRLIVQVAKIARRFHAAGFNHRDFYCCHFLVKETSPGRFDVRLIDLQRVERRRWLRRRWIVKDLAQLASMAPDDQVGCRGKILFLRTYLGVRKLRPQDKRLVRDVLWKLSLIRRRARHKP